MFHCIKLIKDWILRPTGSCFFLFAFIPIEFSFIDTLTSTPQALNHLESQTDFSRTFTLIFILFFTLFTPLFSHPYLKLSLIIKMTNSLKIRPTFCSKELVNLPRYHSTLQLWVGFTFSPFLCAPLMLFSFKNKKIN